MFQLRLAAVVMIPLAIFCSVAAAQQQQPGDLASTPVPSQLKPQTQTTPFPHEEVYGPYVPYVPPTQTRVAPQVSSTSVASTTQSAPPAAQTVSNTPPQQTPLSKTQPQQEVYGPYVPYVEPSQKIASPQTAVIDVTPTTSATPTVQSAASNPSRQGLTAVTQEAPNPANNNHDQTYSQPRAQYTANDFALASGPSSSTHESSSTSEYVRPVPVPSAAREPGEIRPFRSVAVGFKADTLGAGIEFATPVARHFNLRSSINMLAFDYAFTIDGVNYDAKLHLKSSETILDWFPGHGLHISPGILYFKNTMSAPAFVDPGRSFVLGSQHFINSVDDPVSGSASVNYAHSFAPILLLGYGNIIPRSGRHISVPFEFGVAYTGAPQISVDLNGTACTTNGCVNFARNSEAQSFVKQEVDILNEDLKRLPVFPIVSIGVAYHF
jgi:hypothetical protein